MKSDKPDKLQVRSRAAEFLILGLQAGEEIEQ